MTDSLNLSGLYSLAADTGRYARGLDALAREGIELPAEVTALLADARRVTGELADLNPAKLEADALAAVVAGKNVDKAISTLATAETKARVLKQAAIRVVSDLVGTAAHLGNEILVSVREALFTPALAELTEIAETVPAGASVDSLIRAGQHEAAGKLATAPIALDKIRKAHTLLANTPAPVGASLRFKHRDKAADYVRGPASLEAYLDTIRNGAEPWLPTTAEEEAYAAKRRREHEDAVRDSKRRLAKTGMRYGV